MIEIYTLGDWDIRHNGKSMLKSRGEQHRLLNLLKYFLTFEGSKITLERIYEDLLSDMEYYDPKNIIRTQISRLRHMFKDDTFYNIDHIAGYYVFNLKDNCTVDFKKFKELIDRGNFLIDSNPEKARNLLEEGIILYLGEYLMDLHQDWIITIRNRYSRMYLNGLYNYLRVLRAHEEHEKIIEMTEKAIKHNPYEEMLNIYFIESLIKTGQRGYALNHYEYFTSKLYRDLKISPSNFMKDVYSNIREQNESIQLSNYIQVSAIENAFKRNCRCSENDLCSLQYFNILYNDKSAREMIASSKNNQLVLVTIRDKNRYKVPEQVFQERADSLIGILSNNLRKRDVYFKCKEGHILILLYNTDLDVLNIITDRIQRSFMEKIDEEDILLDFKFESI